MTTIRVLLVDDQEPVRTGIRRHADVHDDDVGLDPGQRASRHQGSRCTIKALAG
ncbi:hypothetical protein [Nonomuraea sp. NPDC002799]